MLPRRHQPESHRLDPLGNALLVVTLLLLLVPLVEGQATGGPLWSWICLACCAPAAALLAWWEARLARRGGEPVIRRDLLRHRSFALGSLLTASNSDRFSTRFGRTTILGGISGTVAR